MKAIAKLLALVLALALCLSLCACGQETEKASSYKEAMENYVEAMCGEEGALEKLAPKSYWDYIRDVKGYSKRELEKEIFEESAELLSEEFESLEKSYGNDVTVSYNILEKEKLDDGLLEHIMRDLSLRYIGEDFKVSRGYLLTWELVVEGSEAEDSIRQKLMYVVEIGDNWYPLRYESLFCFAADELYGD